MSNYETIKFEATDGVCTITLNRPEVLNAFNEQLTTELAEVLKQVGRDEGVRAVVLTGAGRAFCSGQDLAELKVKYTADFVPAFGDDLRRRYDPIIKRMRTMEKPIVGAINGVAAGAGCSVALACDLRIAAQSATFIEVFINVGLVPDSASTFMLPRLIGLGRAMEMCCLGNKVTAADALAMGMVNQVVPDGELREAAGKLAVKLTKMPTRGIALTKRLLNDSFTNDLNTQLEAEAFAQDTAGKTADHREGVMAFLEKRKPQFRGR